MKLLILIISSLCLSLITVKPAYSIEKADSIEVLLVTSIGDCNKCVNLPTMAIDAIMQDPLLAPRVKTKVLVKCNRTKELKLFSNQYGWKYDMEKFEIENYPDLNPNSKRNLFIRNGSGEVLKTYSSAYDFSPKAFLNDMRNILKDRDNAEK